MLEFDYEMKLLGHVTQLVDSESWSFDKVPLQTCLEELGPLEPKWVNETVFTNCWLDALNPSVMAGYMSLTIVSSMFQ